MLFVFTSFRSVKEGRSEPKTCWCRAEMFSCPSFWDLFVPFLRRVRKVLNSAAGETIVSNMSAYKPLTTSCWFLCTTIPCCRCLTICQMASPRNSPYKFSPFCWEIFSLLVWGDIIITISPWAQSARGLRYLKWSFMFGRQDMHTCTWGQLIYS